jgi:uncharacterized UPF0160 family protein
MNKLIEKINKMVEYGVPAYTHAGVFHADDVASAALLKIITPKIQILRCNNGIPEAADLVFDIGRGEFDHHQDGAPIRENGIKYAAFGLLWKAVGADLIDGSQKYADIFDQTVVQPIDAADNGQAPNQLSGLISSMNPNWDSDENPEECFWKAVDIMKQLLETKIISLKSALKAEDIVNYSYKKAQIKKVCVLDKFVPWQQVLVPTECEYVIYPSNRGGYSCTAVPITGGSFETKRPLPESWLVAPPQGINFVHKARFMCNADSLKDLLQAVYGDIYNLNL